eukprot:gene2846-3139_t
MAAVQNSQGSVTCTSSSSSAAPLALYGMGRTASDGDRAAYSGAFIAHLNYAGVQQQPWQAKPFETEQPSVKLRSTNRSIGATAAGGNASSCSSADMPVSHLVTSAHTARTTLFDQLDGMQLIDQELDLLFRLKRELQGKTSIDHHGFSAGQFCGTIGSSSVTSAQGASDVQATGFIAADLVWQIPSSVECMWSENSNQGAAVHHYQPDYINIDIPIVPVTSLSYELAHLNLDSTDLSSFAMLQHQFDTRSATQTFEDSRQQLQQLLVMRQTQVQLQWELAQLLMSLQ